MTERRVERELKTLLFTTQNDSFLEPFFEPGATRVIYSPKERLAFTRLCQSITRSDVVVGFSLAARWLAEENVHCAGAVFLGFPFHQKGEPKTPLGKDALLSFSQRTLVLQGERDPYGFAGVVKRACAERPLTEVCAIPNGNHRFFPKEKSGLQHADNVALAVREVQRFISSSKA